MVTVSEINKKVSALPLKALEELERYIEFLNYKHGDWSAELSEEQNLSLQKGLLDINNNRIVPHEQVKKKMREYLEARQK